MPVKVWVENVLSHQFFVQFLCACRFCVPVVSSHQFRVQFLLCACRFCSFAYSFVYSFVFVVGFYVEPGTV
jgi:hypothetical protein